jgi:Xaa-Pro aminopeptidase
MVSHQERERRYLAIRAAMREDGLDALVVCGSGDEAERGRTRYVSDLYVWNGQTFVILPLKGKPILIQPAYIGNAWAGSVGWITDNRSAVDPAGAVVEALLDLGLGRASIGIVGLESVLTVRDLSVFRSKLPDASLRDATLLFDMVRIIKSEDEIQHLRHTSAILRQAYQSLEELLVPGRTERDVIAVVVARLYELGCTDGFAHIARSGGLKILHPPTSEVIESTDVLTFDLEFIGPEGYALELSRHFSFGPPPDSVRRVYDIQVEVYQRCVEAMRAGASSEAILRAAESAYQMHGFSAAGPSGLGAVQYHAHGIGLDFGELPLVPGRELTLCQGMVVCLHPHMAPEDPSLPDIEIEDSVLITAGGPERLTYERDEWTAL